MDMNENRDDGRFPDIRLVDFCNRFCLSNRINEPTRVTKISKSLIDVLLTRNGECYATSGSLHLELSDHDLIFTVRKNKNSRPKPRLIEFRSMKNFNLPDFLADLKRVPWSSAYTFDNDDDVWAHRRTLFKDVLDQHVTPKEKSGFGATSCHVYHLICCVKFRTEINYSSATSEILHLIYFLG